MCQFSKKISIVNYLTSISRYQNIVLSSLLGWMEIISSVTPSYHKEKSKIHRSSTSNPRRSLRIAEVESLAFHSPSTACLTYLQSPEPSVKMQVNTRNLDTQTYLIPTLEASAIWSWVTVISRVSSVKSTLTNKSHLSLMRSEAQLCHSMTHLSSFLIAQIMFQTSSKLQTSSPSRKSPLHKYSEMRNK